MSPSSYLLQIVHWPQVSQFPMIFIQIFSTNDKHTNFSSEFCAIFAGLLFVFMQFSRGNGPTVPQQMRRVKEKSCVILLYGSCMQMMRTAAYTI